MGLFDEIRTTFLSRCVELADQGNIPREAGLTCAKSLMNDQAAESNKQTMEQMKQNHEEMLKDRRELEQKLNGRGQTGDKMQRHSRWS